MRQEVVSRYSEDSKIGSDKVDYDNNFIFILLDGCIGRLDFYRGYYMMICISEIRVYPWEGRIDWYKTPVGCVEAALRAGAKVYSFSTFPEVIAWMSSLHQ